MSSGGRKTREYERKRRAPSDGCDTLKTEYKQKKCTRAERAFRVERTFVATPVATTVQITEGEALERNACSETSTPA
ncbi:hypothetical protein NDU88_002146 [Pleurodeles waltl]|uniref:Uncharacterized protein n=1 Tax=Pleurodeles waltl TaxID=8319 RepID=A0AAV7SCE1_PLEWA|nr:hypothetical protein NDU88_002146 [Pleurodeles waltl]